MVKLQEEDATLVHQMLLFLYSSDYDDTHPTQHPYEFNARMYALADKYGIEDLKNFAQYSLSMLLRYPAAPALVNALRVIYTTTLSSDRGLRDLVVPAIKQCRVDLRNNDEFMNMLGSGLDDGGFAADVFDALLELAEPKTYECHDCEGDTFPERFTEELHCWKCKEEVGFVVGPEFEP